MKFALKTYWSKLLSRFKRSDAVLTTPISTLQKRLAEQENRLLHLECMNLVLLSQIRGRRTMPLKRRKTSVPQAPKMIVMKGETSTRIDQFSQVVDLFTLPEKPTYH